MTKRTPATIIAACRAALNLLDAPAPPPSAEPPDAGELVSDLKALVSKFHEGWHDGIEIDASELVLLHTAADWIEQDARGNAALMLDMHTMRAARDKAETAMNDALRQLQAAQACIVAADAMREYVDTTNFAAPAAYDAARRAFASPAAKRISIDVATRRPSSK